MLAVLRGSRANFLVMSFAICPVVIMAIVLLAVQRLAAETRAAMLSSAPRFDLTRRVMPEVMKSSPPFVRITSSIPPASIVTIMRSAMPLIPLPMDSSQRVQLNFPEPKPMTALAAVPIVSTAATSTPDIARAITAAYGRTRTHSTGSAALGISGTEEPSST